MTLFLSFFGSFTVKAQDYHHKEFEWSYNEYDWTWSLDIPISLYEAYKSVPVSTRLLYQSSGYGFLTTTNDVYLEMVAEKLQEASSQEGFESYDEVSFVLAFIQSLPYTSDSVTSGYDEYPRFPLETLVDNGGDCEDTAILFATLTLIMGYGTVYINPPEHYAVGILGEEGLPGYYFTYKNKRYYYCETTGEGWEIGDLPPEYQDVEATIYEIREYQQYVPTWNPITPSPSPTPSLSPTTTPTLSPTPTPTPTPTVEPTPTPTPIFAPTPEPSPTATSTPQPTTSLLPTPSPWATPMNTPLFFYILVGGTVFFLVTAGIVYFFLKRR
jgi:hypothetical protein